MVIVDRRDGSRELFTAISKKTDAVIDTLEAGDFAFEGNVESGRGLVGIERKTVSDALDCMLSGRFAGVQLIGMSDTYASMHLIVEGLWRPQTQSGLMEVWNYNKNSWVTSHKGSRTFMYADFSHFLMTLAIKTSLRVWRTSSPGETAQMVADLYSWFNDKTWNGHTSHLQMYDDENRRASFRKPSMRRTVAKCFPNVSWKRSQDLEAVFPDTLTMVNASINQLMQTPGIGKDTATKIYEKIRSE